ncbi:hypothetical protein [Nonomuraea sp. KM88]|uniref:hypothetical protein n=1 Tax=Nonomuraea sp. KM88 TaxID=3457427 RepID=UPI003FCDE0C7
MTVYLSGMAVNALLAVAALILYNATPPGGLHNAAAVLFVLQPIMLATQFMFFMRTDVYFVVQDLARCRMLRRLGTAVSARRSSGGARAS